MIVSLPAFADEPPDLAAAERTADELIHDCREHGADCGATADDLARAFVTTAVAGAVLRGELDRTAVADAELLSPGIVDEWRALIPTAADRPDGWVGRWVDGPVPDDPFREEASTPRAPAVPPPLPFEVSVRLAPWSAPGDAPFDWSGAHVAVGSRGPVGPATALLEVDSGGSLGGWSQELVMLGVGKTWRFRNEAEFVLFGGLSASIGDSDVGLGPQVGTLLRAPFLRGVAAIRFLDAFGYQRTLGGDAALTWYDQTGFELHATDRIGLTIGWDRWYEGSRASSEGPSLGVTFRR